MREKKSNPFLTKLSVKLCVIYSCLERSHCIVQFKKSWWMQDLKFDTLNEDNLI